MMEQLDRVELFRATTTSSKALLVVLAEMCVQGGTVFTTPGGGVSGV